MRTLPSTFEEYPFFFSDADKEYLKGSHLLEMIKEDRESKKQMFRVLNEECPMLSKFSFEDWVKALKLIDSRALKNDENPALSLYMGPILDLANHKTNGDVASRHYDHDKKAIVVRASKDIKAGEEITFDYGNHQMGNLHYFMKYGFIDNDLHFTAFIPFSLDSKD